MLISYGLNNNGTLISEPPSAPRNPTQKNGSPPMAACFAGR
jgi:hypothetical protein